ncbi:hypothetical protein [Anaerosalibacter sp. Marseille-P3206]|uniref:hypothetical protein n=1 Tax=Anaerosalibacter sp. Marseille-P3206 TaxID=1871005 RepID=UPI00190E8BE3|nr:hypothetical protein [Anaerosalibacter sp. Marseille-P3206]
MKIIESNNSEEVIIDNLKIDGFVTDKKCSKCNNKLIYYKKYDSYFCANCNEWTEKKLWRP